MTDQERNNLIINHMDLAEQIAKNKRKSIKLQFDDLRSAAYLGLVDAAWRFEEAKGSFRRYAAYRILGEVNEYIRREIDRNNKFISLDENKHINYLLRSDGGGQSFFSDIIHCLPDKGKNLLRLYYCDQLTLKQIADRIGISESFVSILMKKYRNVVRSNY
jgi:RNA polymerase sigma factor (sigma-70 family)